MLSWSVLSGRRPATEPEWKDCLILHVWLNLERFQRRGLYLQPHPVEPRPETVHPLLCKYLPQTLTNSGNDPTFGSFMFSFGPAMVSSIFHWLFWYSIDILTFYQNLWYFIDSFDIILISYWYYIDIIMVILIILIFYWSFYAVIFQPRKWYVNLPDDSQRMGLVWLAVSNIAKWWTFIFSK